MNKYDINDVFVATALGAGVISSLMTGSIVVGMFVVLGVSAACVYTGAIRF